MTAASMLGMVAEGFREQGGKARWRFGATHLIALLCIGYLQHPCLPCGHLV